MMNIQTITMIPIIWERIKLVVTIEKRYLKGEIPLKYGSYITVVKELEEYSVILNVALEDGDELPIKLDKKFFDEIHAKVSLKIQQDINKTELELHKEEYLDFIEILNGVSEES